MPESNSGGTVERPASASVARSLIPQLLLQLL